MMPRDRFADARSLLAAATTAPDLELRVIFAARARATFTALAADVEAFARELGHVEAELVRVTKGREP